jgi:hypothetical protein
VFAVIDSLARTVVGLMIFFGVLYALVRAALAPIHEKLDRMLAVQGKLAERITELERASAEHV